MSIAVQVGAMSIKSQLNSTRDFLMVGIRASSRVSAQKP